MVEVQNYRNACFRGILSADNSGVLKADVVTEVALSYSDDQREAELLSRTA